MIEPERFVANKAISFDGWVDARNAGVTATEVAKGATPAGFSEVVQRYREPEEPFDNPFMEFGRRSEGPISLWVKEQFQVFPNEWLIAGTQPHHMATPDGLSLDHKVISEIKTTGRDFEDNIPIQYRRQVQWQLHVTGANRCFFVWMLRVEDQFGGFQPGWIEPKHKVIRRDQKMIDDLITVAEKLHREKRKAQNA